MEARCSAALLLAVLLALAAHATGLPAAGDGFKKALCKDVCGDINGLDTFYDGECFCVLSHDPTPAEKPACERAEQRAKDAGVPFITSVVGYDIGANREERCLLGVSSALRARASKARPAALREPVVIESAPAAAAAAGDAAAAAIAAAGINIGQVAVPLALPEGCAQAPAPPGTIPVNILTVAGPLTTGKVEADAENTRTPLGRARLRARQRAEAKALLGSKAAGGLLGAASVPRYALSDLVVAPVQTGGAPFLDSSTATFSSMAGALGLPFRGQQQFDGPLGTYQPQEPQQQQQTVILEEFPSMFSQGAEFVRSAAQRAADSGAQAAHAAVSQATDFASAATGAGLGAARGAVDNGRWASTTGLNLADEALSKADELSSAALRAQMKSADQTVDFMVPPGASVSANAQTQISQPRDAAPNYPTIFTFGVMNPGVYYPDIRAAGAMEGSASEPQMSTLSQRSVKPEEARAVEPRGVLTDAATAVAGAVENAYHTVASGVQSGAHSVANVVHGVAHDVSSGVQTGVSTASNVAQDTYQGVVQGVQAGASTAADTVHEVAHGVVGGVQSGVSTASNIAQDAYQGVSSGVHSGVATASDLAHDAYQGVATGVHTGASTLTGLATGALNAAQGLANGAGHGIQHAVHQIGTLGHAAEEDAKHLMAQARAASAMDPLQAAASQALQAVQSVQGAAGSARDFVTSTANQGVNVAQNAQALAAQQVHDVADKVQGSVQEVAGRVRGSVQDVAGQVRGTVQDVAGQGAQAVRGVTDAVKSTVVSAAGDVRGQLQDLQQAVKGSVLDAQNAARDAILAAATQGGAKSQQMSQGAIDAAQAAVSAAIDKVRQAMNLASATGGASARSAGDAAAQGLGALRSAYQVFKPSSQSPSSPAFSVGLSPVFSMTPSSVVTLGANPTGRSSFSWRWSRSPSDGLAIDDAQSLGIGKHTPSPDALNRPVYVPKA